MPDAVWGSLVTGILALAALVVSQRMAGERLLLEARRNRLFDTYKPVVILLNEWRQLVRVYGDRLQRALTQPLMKQAIEGSAESIVVITLEPAARAIEPLLHRCSTLVTEFLTAFDGYEATSDRAPKGAPRPIFTQDILDDLIKRRDELFTAIEAVENAMRQQLQDLDETIAAPRILPLSRLPLAGPRKAKRLRP